MEIKTIRRKLKDVCSIKSSNIILNKIVKGDYPLFGAMGNVVEYINKFDNENFISIVKDGAGVGRLNFFEDKGSIIGTMDYIETKNNVDKKYLYYLLKTIKFDKYIIGSTIPHIYYKDWSKHEISFLIDINKQKMIGEFLSNIDKKIELINTQVKNIEEFKNSILIKILIFTNSINKNNYFIGDLIEEYSEKNLNSEYEPVSIGKYGIRKRSDIYKHKLSKNISNNKIIFKNTITFGMGTKNIEYGVKLNNEINSVSPAYKTFKINEKLINPFYLNLVLNSINKVMSKKFMIIGARQGKSLDFEGIKKFTIFISNIDTQKEIISYISNVEKKVNLLNKKLLIKKELKSKILESLFN